jgi:hypothetical protein
LIKPQKNGGRIGADKVRRCSHPHRPAFEGCCRC